ncbi:ABC transporter ATP-binding protein [Pontiella agarivorans]|uniref:Sn-glycerol-3-phosphate ABC transporter ATP-binding protein UgpC n=1 Tax=Pontiella agarivorans TaxID=3038953 RepID=A0ABU5MTS8_9BACT|nr:sn-glycerol-3-phosphate ABC transporter ATP-binding protein UgpC [Pontiella agarivorans]MDZ8117612.1 sn-glycerol-3-phosphate ABC transporter ATP-binding protein UgpC [Pontiella agarivorans]
MAQVRLEKVSKKFEDGQAVVSRFNLEISNGEFLVLVGPSGCGKSTTLRMIAGLEDVSEGRIYIGDRCVNEIPPKDRDIAMVFQNYALYPHMTVYDNMAFGLKLRKISKQEIHERVNRAARILDLENLLKRKPKALSGGQRQRVAMGRAIVRKPAVFLFDEPLSNLDAKMRVEMRKEIIQLHSRVASTMIYVTHDQIEAMTLGDRICVMNQGVIEQVGRPRTIFDYPATLFVAGFIGTPAMNIFRGSIVSEKGLFFDGGTFRIPVPQEQVQLLKAYIGQAVCFGIRPRALNKLNADETADFMLSGKYEISEMIGEEILLHMVSGEHHFVASIHPHQFSETEPAEISFGLDHRFAHFFDAETGRNITLPENIARETLISSTEA